MHLYVMTRGQKNKVDRYIEDLQAQWWPYPGAGGAQAPPGWIQMGVRPLQMWELVFPKEELPSVLRTVLSQGKLNDWRQKYLTALRIMLRAEKLPNIDFSKAPMRMVRKEDVAIYPIGIRKDKNFEGAEYL